MGRSGPRGVPVAPVPRRRTRPARTSRACRGRRSPTGCARHSGTSTGYALPEVTRTRRRGRNRSRRRGELRRRAYPSGTSRPTTKADDGPHGQVIERHRAPWRTRAVRSPRAGPALTHPTTTPSAYATSPGAWSPRSPSAAAVARTSRFSAAVEFVDPDRGRDTRTSTTSGRRPGRRASRVRDGRGPVAGYPWPSGRW